MGESIGIATVYETFGTSWKAADGVIDRFMKEFYE